MKQHETSLEILETYKNDSSKIWKLYDEMIGTQSKINDKSSIPDYFVLMGKPVSDKYAVAAEFI